MTTAMIYLGENDQKKIIEKYLKTHEVNRVCIIGDDVEFNQSLIKDSDLLVNNEKVWKISYSETIQYKFYYPWLQAIDKNTLVVWNKVLRTSNRYCLHYNCIRRYMQQTPHRLIFEYFPIRSKEEDIMILYDMTLNNPFLKEPYDTTKLKASLFRVVNMALNVEEIAVKFSKDDKKAYEAEKEKLIAQVKKDPDIVPRRLLKWTEARAAKILGTKLERKQDSKITIKPNMLVTVTDTGVDEYYMQRIKSFNEALNNVREKIQHK